MKRAAAKQPQREPREEPPGERPCSREGRRWQHRVQTVLTVALLFVSAGASGAPVDRPGMKGFRVHETFQLQSALGVAQERLNQNPSCRDLFRGRPPGTDLLNTALYKKASREQEKQICQDGKATLFTTVGGQRVGVCQRAFERLSRYQLATALIHEALHMAGVQESPASPNAPTSAELNRLVGRECEL